MHYTTLATLVMGFGWQPVGATLVGYLCGGIVSYMLNRSFTFQSTRNHTQAGWRFVVVAAVGFGFTYLLMHEFIDRMHLEWLLAQVLTTAIVLVWSFAASKYWTFVGDFRAR